ncbi:hypothetical protein E4U32_000594 [Claviceps aff. humidiphila group G2b]|nr:hypothetical protein E4U32_000594 [Claviceps aff. humidiphila group G2b]
METAVVQLMAHIAKMSLNTLVNSGLQLSQTHTGCVDKGAYRGIDGTAFEAFCKMQFRDVFGGLEQKVKGRCWH